MSYKIGLVGNPNVGKSTLFNNLTKAHQHTGNWSGKTVSNAYKNCSYKDEIYTLYDLPGTYSLNPHSEEEKVTRDFVLSRNYDALIVVCDATTLERNLYLVLQVLQITNKVVLCINLIDEAKKKNMEIDLLKLSKILEIPVIGTVAKHKKRLNNILVEVKKVIDNEGYYQIFYPESLRKYTFEELQTLMENRTCDKTELLENGITQNKLKTIVATTINNKATDIFKKVVIRKDYKSKDQKIDRLVTGKFLKNIFMLLLLGIIFWITIIGSNYPSEILFSFFGNLKQFLETNVPGNIFTDMLIDGVYQVTTWVVSVMLPPMLIFFPLFTLLEDSGILPRIAFNLDHYFKKCATCGKQALTMMMGFGCNAVGVSATRIIDSKRERIIAMITNCMVPCNGRFPTIIALISIFLVTNSSIIKALVLVGVITFGIMVTMLSSMFLSKTILKGMPSFFTLELPSYRKPDFLKVVVRSVLDKAIFVLFRAVVVAAPAGLIIWILANTKIGDISLLLYLAKILDPIASLFGFDGAILLGFILGFPANEIVLPIILMIYLANGTLVNLSDLTMLKELLVSNGWTVITAICFIVFSLIHFPCSTTCLTIKKESNFKWMGLAFLIPTVIGLLLCFIISHLLKFFL